ncbi:MAG TPA: hypothetical protein VGK29_25295 [Paludibaculum sp.]
MGNLPLSQGAEPPRNPTQACIWLSLAVAGQAVVLSTIDAGKQVHFQHAYPLAHPACMAFVLLQVALVAAGFWRTGLRPPARSYWLLPLFIATAATVSRNPVLWGVETAFAALAQLASLGSLLLAARTAPNSIATALKQAVMDPRPRLPLAAATLTCIAAALLNQTVYQAQPHLQDEVAHLHAARSFAAGRILMPPPPVPQAFDYYLLDLRPDHTSLAPPPGYPLLLVPAVWLGAPWLVNALLGGLNVGLLYLLLRKLYEPPVPLLGALLLAASPWHLFLAMSFMNHTPVLTAILLASLGVLHGSVAAAAGAGAALGWLSFNRPLDAAAFAGLCLIWMFVRRGPWPALLASSVAVGALVLPYNHAITGNALKLPLADYLDRVFGAGTNALGFGANRGFPWPLDPFPGHGLPDVIVNAQLNLSTLNTELFGWASGSLIFLLAFVAIRKWSPADRWMAAIAVSTVAVYSLYWFSGGPDFGPRYWFMLLMPAIALTARGIVLARERYGDRTFLLAALLSLSAWVTFVPWRSLDKYYGYLGMTPQLQQLATREHFGRSLVVIRGPSFPDYAAVAWTNPVDWQGDGPVYARDAGPGVVDKLRAAYPDRPVWVVDGPSQTGAGYRIVERPSR